MNKSKNLLNLNLSNKFLISFYYSLLLALIGIFLLPNLAYLTSINGEKIIELTNKERIKNNLEIVTANQLLTKAAYEKGKAIFDSQTFQHNINDKKFSSWIKEAGYKYFYAGENLAIDFATNEGTIEAWLESPTHKKNILNENFREIGVAVIEGEFDNNNTTIIVQIFGSPLSENITNYAGLNLSENKTLISENPNYYQKQNYNFPFKNIQTGQAPEILLTHSTENFQNKPVKYQISNEFQILKNYQLIKAGVNKINANKSFVLSKINILNNTLISNYILLIILSLILILFESFLRPASSGK
ncbi:hypothetical protein DRH27_02120 [Candidatus Falkowbacteria bacterium]|nr:MAG: hypothetical protein DRH27_02120 [Candidatus Falkowbacteria bacterium]